jgi:glucose-6-phosphate 1-epimerase
VVWNPGPQKAARLGDMPAEDWTRMLCIEAAAVGVPVQLAPGKTWRGMQRIELPQSAGFDLSQATPVSAG